MHIQSKFEIERLSEAREGRIEEALFERLRKVRPLPLRSVIEPHAPALWKPAIAFVFAGATAAVIGALGVRWLRATGPGSSFVASDRLAPSHIVASRSGSHMQIGESELYLSPESEASIDGDDTHGIVVRLERGAVECEVRPRLGRPPFIVRAGAVNIKVVGTHFRVARSEGGAAVDVDRGIVEVGAPGGEPSELRAGEHWVWPRSEASQTKSAVGSPPATGTDSTAGGRTDRTSGASSNLAIDRYNRAVELEGRSPEQALAIYGSLAQGSGPWAMNALFASGRLEADRGDHAKAVSLLSEYLARYPQGPNVEDARQLLTHLR